MSSRIWSCICVALLLLPTLGHGAEEVLLDEAALTAKLDKTSDYQLLDARNAEAQRLAPIAFSTRYRSDVAMNKELVLIIANTDGEALEIAKSIPAKTGRSVFAVRGGAEVWTRVAQKADANTPVGGNFIIPKNTCEPSKTLQKYKRNTQLEQIQKN